jgi:hypothetical protein
LRSKNMLRDWQQGHEWIYYVYFTLSLMFDEVLFKRMYRMTQNLFLHIMSFCLWVWCFLCAMPRLYKEARIVFNPKMHSSGLTTCIWHKGRFCGWVLQIRPKHYNGMPSFVQVVVTIF